MFKGFISLFTSGVIFNPFVLVGVILGTWCYTTMSLVELKSIFFNEIYYVILLVVSFVYVVCFSKVYNRGGYSLDWNAMGIKILANVFKFIVSFTLVMPFISMISIF